ncbi:MAG: hypothetical protein M3R38_05530 [Actinomycetota bacterium]|nr:hypothetical protein [Actinomycetota bacterium]MDP9484478.1 hypothetical protein [Actinomycetota bacterium]
MSFFWQTMIGVAQLVVSFYGFWLVWRVLLPVLPGPRDPKDRIAPYDRYFTDPFVLPLARRLRIHQRLVSAVLLLLVAAAQVGLGRLGSYF